MIAQSAPCVSWEADAIAIYAPNAPAEFWSIVEQQPVAFAQLESLGRLGAERFAAEFSPRPECGPGIYERRPRLR